MSPSTLVAPASTIEACREPMKSLETASGALMKSIWRFSGEVSDTSRRYSRTSARVVSRLSCRLRMAIDTSGVGTRIELPVMVALRSGSAFATAEAAPVSVMTMFSGAERPRRSPLW